MEQQMIFSVSEANNFIKALLDRVPQLQEIFTRITRADPARTRSGSFGLGLAIAQAIVQAHHGKIWAESRDGRNTFHVELPLRTGREKHQETSEKGI